ncbi:glycosyltransferase family 39 protein [Thermostilla marina]
MAWNASAYQTRWMHKLAIAGLALGIILRAALVFGPGAFADDPDGYRLVATNLVTEGVFGYGTRPTAYRPPLYPLLLAVLRPDRPGFAVRLGCCHFVLGLATAALVWVMGCRHGLGRFAAVPTALVLLDPLLAAQSRLIMTETAAAFLVMATVAVWEATQRMVFRDLGTERESGESVPWPRIALGGGFTGILLGLTCLCRPTFLLWGALGIVGLPLLAVVGVTKGEMRLRRLKRAVGVSVVIAAGCAAALAPWVGRNILALGYPVVGTTHGGYTLYLANNPWFYDFLRGSESPVWNAEEFNLHWESRRRACRGDEVCADRTAYRLAFRAIQDDPAGFAWACVVRFGRFWSPLPHRLNEHESWHRTAIRGLVGAWYLGWTGAFVLGIFRRWRYSKYRSVWKNGWVLWPGLACAVALSGAHTLFWSNMRMRAPLMPVLWLWTAVVVCGNLEKCEGCAE